VPLSVEELAAKTALSLVRLRSNRGEALGFLFSNEGHLAACLHGVLGAEWLRARLPDGRELDDLEALGTDARRDLAVLRLRVAGLRPLPLSPDDPVEGMRLVAVGLTGPREIRVEAVRPLGPGLELAELDEVDDADAGAPLLNERGEVVALALAAQRNDSSVSLGVPASCLRAYLALSAGRPWQSLRRRAAIQRAVPDHSLGLLEHSAALGLERVLEALSGAIQVGAPAYNEGDIAACYRVYRETAERLVAERHDCPGVQRALSEGMERASGLGDVDERAWAMRDCFDGLLAVIQRWFEAQTRMGAAPPGKKSYLN
jgi:hypothetical protein